MAQRTLAFIGSITRPAPYFPTCDGEGISVLEFDETTGALSPLHITGGIDNPSYLTLDAPGRTLYAVSEVFGWHEGDVTAYRIDPATGALAYLNKQPTRGSIAAHASVDATGKWLLVANYRIGEDGARAPQAAVVYPIEADGGIGPAVCSVAHNGSGPNAARQECSHPHCAVPSPDNRFVLVADLGIDEIVVYAFDAATGQLSRASSVTSQPGAGPRHLVFSPSGSHVYVTNELNSTVSAYAWNAAEGRLTHLHTASSLPEGGHPDNTCSDIGISADGRFLYAANRGHDSIAAFAISADGGILTRIGDCPTGAPTPRQFTLDFTGRFILVANQNSNQVVVMARDPATGLLTDTGHRGKVGTPMCVKLLRTGA